MKSEIKLKGLNCDEICAKIDDWMEYYNNERYVWDFHKLSPNEYYDWIANGIWPLDSNAPELPEFADFVLPDEQYSSFYLGGQPPNPRGLSL